jgi:hypothetical protein
VKSILLIIGLLFTVCTVNAQKKESVIECFDILFSRSRFDTVFYKRKPHEDVTCFFALKDSTIEKFLNVQDFESTPYKLKNGNLFSIQPRNYLFVWGVDYFVRFINYSLTDEKVIFVFQEMNNNGFNEKVLRTREVVFVKKDVWQLMEEKNW